MCCCHEVRYSKSQSAETEKKKYKTIVDYR